jgi:multiple sugar transport system permease protein
MIRTLKKSSFIIFFLPTLTFLFFGIVYPMVWSINTSFYQWVIGSNPVYVGLKNYHDILIGTLSKDFGYSVYITVILTLLTVTFQLIIGMGIALLIYDRTQNKIIRSIFLLPMVIPPVISGMIWGNFIYNPSYGILNYILSFFGVNPQLWTYSSQQAIPSIIVILVWQWTPFVVLLLSAGLESLSKAPLEAAVIDGASSWQIFWYVKLPLLKSIILAVTILRLMDTLRAFDIIISTTLGGPGRATEILNIMTYLTAFVHFNMGVASALGVILFIISLISVILMQYFLRER